MFAENELWIFFKYSTAYASFSLNAPRHQEDRFAIVGGLSSGALEVARTERELKPDFQTSFGLRKIGVAVGNTLTKTTMPLDIIYTKNGNTPWGDI